MACNGFEETVDGRLVFWFVGYGDESTGWCVDERRGGKLVRILSGIRSYEDAVKSGRGYYSQLRASLPTQKGARR